MVKLTERDDRCDASYWQPRPLKNAAGIVDEINLMLFAWGETYAICDQGDWVDWANFRLLGDSLLWAFS
jgi:hypothetical protein